jgi:GT2 family glycosyltransferase
MAEQHPRVAAAIVSFNHKHAVVRLLQRLEKLNIPAFLTENASSDGTLEAIQGRFPNLTILESQHNLGGTGGFNCALLAALAANSDYIVMLDDDLLPDEACIDQLADFLDAHHAYAFAAPAIYIAARPDTLQETGGGVDFSKRQPVVAWNRFEKGKKLPPILDID